MKAKELGHVVLYVRSLERSLGFYRDLLGFPVVGDAFGGKAAALSTGRTHHELLLIEVGEDAAPIPQGRRVGLYHIGVKVGDTDDELREAQRELVAAGTPMVGASDHTVTHSLYVLDPDGNEVEVFIDAVPASTWRDDPSSVMAPIKPLRL